METYFARVRLPNGSIATVPVTACNPGQVRQIVEGQYGSGAFRGLVTS